MTAVEPVVRLPLLGDRSSPVAHAVSGPPLSLSRLSITGPVDLTTPVCVLLEIAAAHGISVRNFTTAWTEGPSQSEIVLALLQSLRKQRACTVTQPLDHSGYQILGRFVNPAETWNRTTLLRAYNFLVTFSTPHHDLLGRLPAQWTVGAATRQQPYLVNACILYAICRSHGVPTTPLTSLVELERAVRLCAYDVIALRRMARLQLDRDRADGALIGWLAQTQVGLEPLPLTPDFTTYVDPLPVPTANHDLLVQVHHQLHAPAELHNRIIPTTDAGAVALAALVFHTDITGALAPLREYDYMRTVWPGQASSERVHQDTFLRKWTTVNPRLFDLTYFFSPVFPREFYSEGQLRRLCRLEGLSCREVDELDHTAQYATLQTIYYNPTFYMGLVPPLLHNRTLIDLEEYAAVAAGGVVSYGCRGREPRPAALVALSSGGESSLLPTLAAVEPPRLVTYNLTQLGELFRVQRSFADPDPHQPARMFSARAVAKLRLLATVNLAAHQPLVDIIDEIERYNQQDPACQTLLDRYRSLSGGQQELVLETLELILLVAHFMRGGTAAVGEPFMVSGQPVDAAAEIDQALNITATYARIDTNLVQMSRVTRQCEGVSFKLCDVVLALPLVRQRDGQYVPSINETDGLTLGVRLSLAKQADPSNQTTCIRLSSNWLAATCHKYLVALGKPAPFDLALLRAIA